MTSVTPRRRKNRAPAAPVVAPEVEPFYITVRIGEDRNPFTLPEWRGAAMIHFDPALILPNGRRIVLIPVKRTRDAREVVRRLERNTHGRVRLEIAVGPRREAVA